MKKRASITIVVLSLAALAAAQPQPVGIFTFSRDSSHGFDDERLDTFRRELGKYASSVMELAYERESADAAVQFLGQGELAVELDTDGAAVRHLWTPDEGASRMWAIVRVGSFSKEFSVEGAGGRDLSKLARILADWLLENSARLRGTGRLKP